VGRIYPTIPPLFTIKRKYNELVKHAELLGTFHSFWNFKKIAIVLEITENFRYFINFKEFS
jgi:hypothetical protein